MFELTLLAHSASAEAVSDALLEEHGALSVTVEDADAGTAAEHPLFGEPGMAPPAAGWERSVVRALFVDAAAAEAAAARLLASTAIEAPPEDAHEARQQGGLAVTDESTTPAAALDPGGGLTVHSIAPVADADWVRLTQAQFPPTEIGPGFWVVPSWDELPDAASRVIRLDPGMAFGTGTHPTTRMCLRWIARQSAASAAPWDGVLDYGCGSGILAIAAALHGARAIDAVDIDPAAVEATRYNAGSNGVSLDVGPPDQARGRYALVLANILASPLKLLAPLLSSHVAPGGHLVLAGILERQVEEIQAAYREWLELDVADTDEGWVLMTGQLEH